MWWQTFFDSTYLKLWGHLYSPEQCRGEAQQLTALLDLGPGAQVLDAPCGYGRISLPLARLGMAVTALDYSDDLLDHGRKLANLEEFSIPICWRQDDLRSAQLGTGFHAAINLFSSIGYSTEEDDLLALRTLHGALAPGGKLFIETVHRDFIVHAKALGQISGIRGPSGITLRERNQFDPVRGTIDSTWTWTSPTIAGSKNSRIRIYSITELVALVERAGFCDVQCFAGISRTPLTEANLDERLGLLCTRGAARG